MLSVVVDLGLLDGCGVFGGLVAIAQCSLLP